MKKSILATLLFGVLASTAFAGWSPSVQVIKLKVSSDNRVFFTTSWSLYPNEGRAWVFDGNTAQGKNMLSILISSKTTGIGIKFNETTAVPGVPTWYYANEVELQ